jgi:hypothetical protein
MTDEVIPTVEAPAPSNNLPSWTECSRIIENHAFRERAAQGLEGSVLDLPPTSPKPTALHRFIYEYDDADSYRSAWFLHRLELLINEVRAAPTVEAGGEETPVARLLPRPGSPEASAMLDSLLAEYNWPANPKNAARAGWEAAHRWLVTRPTKAAAADLHQQIHSDDLAAPLAGQDFRGASALSEAASQAQVPDERCACHGTGYLLDRPCRFCEEEGPTGSIPVSVLREHWLHAMECDHETKQDKPHCACSRVDLGWHPSVGAAVEAWLEHVVVAASPAAAAGVPTNEFKRCRTAICAASRSDTYADRRSNLRRLPCRSCWCADR